MIGKINERRRSVMKKLFLVLWLASVPFSVGASEEKPITFMNWFKDVVQITREEKGNQLSPVWNTQPDADDDAIEELPETEVMKSVIAKMCVYPSQEATEILEARETDDPMGVMEKIYASDFSEQGFEDFCKNRYPLSILSAAEENQCKIQVDKIELLKEATDTDSAYYYKVSFLLNDEIPVNQKVIACYKNQKITKFQLVNSNLIDKIIELGSRVS